MCLQHHPISFCVSSCLLQSAICLPSATARSVLPKLVLESTLPSGQLTQSSTLELQQALLRKHQILLADSDGAVALASGNYGGGPWVWLGGNDCQASAEAVAGTGFNDDSGAFAAAGAQACLCLSSSYSRSRYPPSIPKRVMRQDH